ncbi:hypothetical protein [Rhodopseudomonas palustris]|uniref:hypothetical protein n=1 Tax=Rhodopseudomonas TaxID=1073 RepID=UPI0021F3008D|nr:hypothetical protein [Rhodopseudomonas palustris]UYO48210.1 hypothetical protein KQX64_20005 [Rhodopseudomonas palustris]UYO52928.1 hypothetical protein KQX61_20370 [Rhodopseudomonas palustris]
MDSLLATPKIPDKVRVLCGRCRVPFREKIKNMREGFQTQCPNCNRLITFSSDSADLGVQRAMTEARRIRNGGAAAAVYGGGTERL